jgi:hypothetical protein
MKQDADKFTIDAFNKPGRGRPRKPDAKTDAQRMREYRKRKRESGGELQQNSVTTKKEVERDRGKAMYSVTSNSVSWMVRNEDLDLGICGPWTLLSELFFRNELRK